LSSYIRLTVEERLLKIKSFAFEILKEKDLLELLTKKQFPICYDGFEPSGRMHIAQGIL
jgi:tyrosyl-tRNA synthetase